MDRIRKTKSMAITILVIIMVLLLPAQVRTEEKKPINYVFLISVGGLNQEGLAGNPLPNLKYLMLEGTTCEKTLAIRADTMEAAEASLLTGALASEHKHLTVNDTVEVESLLDILKRNGKSFMVVDGSGGKLNSFAYGDKEYRKLEAEVSSKEIMDEAYQSFSKNKPFFSYIYIDDCTDALLRMDQDDYYRAIKKFDDQLGVFLKKLKDNGILGESLIVVTSARSTSASNQVPFIISGPGSKINSTMSGSMIIDVAPTICRLIGFDIPAAARGLPMYGAFAVSEEARAALNSNWIRDLQKDRQANWNMNYRLEDELYRNMRQMVAIKEEKQSIFDFAGEREQTLLGLKSRLTLERCAWLGILILMLVGYGAEYLFLKRKYLLFK